MNCYKPEKMMKLAEKALHSTETTIQSYQRDRQLKDTFIRCLMGQIFVFIQKGENTVFLKTVINPREQTVTKVRNTKAAWAANVGIDYTDADRQILVVLALHYSQGIF